MANDIKPGAIRTLLLDIGKVLLTNGWDADFRDRAIEKFGLDKKEMEERHAMAFDNYELSKITFDEYLNWVVFYEPRNFSKEEFANFIFEQSTEIEGNIGFFKALKNKHQLKVFAVSNEGREINEYRIEKFRLDELFDGYISSCYVSMHKPGKEILQLACDISHTAKENALYIDDRKLLVDVAKEFGLQTLHFKDLAQAKQFLETCTFYK